MESLARVVAVVLAALSVYSSNPTTNVLGENDSLDTQVSQSATPKPSPTVSPSLTAEDEDSDDVVSSPKPSEKPSRLENVRERRLETANKLKQIREQARLKYQEIKDEFRKKLEGIKDEKKQTTAQNIYDRLVSLNDKWVNQWNDILTKINELLAKATSRADKLASDGKDVTAVRSAITAAQSAIDTAQSAVNTQAAKTYTITVTTDERLGSAVKTVITSFHSDVKAVIEKMQTARQSVAAVLAALGKASGEDRPQVFPSATPQGGTQ